MSADAAAMLERMFEEMMIGETVPVRERTKLMCLTWDSLMQLRLISAIEQEFQVTVSDEEAVDLNSFAAALALVQEKLQAKKGQDGSRV